MLSVRLAEAGRRAVVVDVDVVEVVVVVVEDVDRHQPQVTQGAHNRMNGCHVLADVGPWLLQTQLFVKASQILFMKELIVKHTNEEGTRECDSWNVQHPDKQVQYKATDTVEIWAMIGLMLLRGIYAGY